MLFFHCYACLIWIVVANLRLSPNTCIEGNIDEGTICHQIASCESSTLVLGILKSQFVCDVM